MFNPNYMGHEFTKADVLPQYLQRFNYFKCAKCNVTIDYGEGTKIYWIFINNGGWVEFNLTCDEVIIKSIIE
jgi:hypothetical protein